MKKKQVKSNRRLAREKAFQCLFAYYFNPENLELLINSVFADFENENDKAFGIDLIYKVLANFKELQNEIQLRTKNWEYERIAASDKILLMIGIAEILYFPDIPPKVTINEIIEISKEYSTASSGRFINGILDKVKIDYSEKGTLKKAGRGLVNSSLAKGKSKK